MVRANAQKPPASPVFAAKRRSYDPQFFAIKHDIGLKQALRLIAKIGNNRARLDEAVLKLKRY